MRNKIETMRILACPNGMGNTHYVWECANVQSVKRVDDNHIRIECEGHTDTTRTTIDFNDFKIETEPFSGWVVDLRDVDAIAVRYKGREGWNRNYLSQITRKKN